MKQTINRKVGYKRPPKGAEWPPGTSGNPAGRPPNSVTTLLKEKDRQKVADKLYDLAINGELAAIREYLDRTEGRVTETHLIAGVMAHTTPELLEQAQKRLSGALNGTQKLLGKYNASIKEER